MEHAARAPFRDDFGSLRTELVHRAHFRSRRQAKAALFEYIAILYNRRRHHPASATDPPNRPGST
ncbi:MAG: IS3 family transposase [Paracoccaceae bacterium]